MRFGCCCNMIAGKPDGTGVEHIELLADAGFDYAELPLAEMCALSETSFLELVARVQHSGIRCECCNNFFPKTVRLTGPGVDLEAIKTYAVKALDRAARLGVAYVVFGSGGAKQVPEGVSLSDGYWQVVELLKMLAPMAQERVITIVIEPLRRAECNLINSFAEGCCLAKDVGHKNVQVLTDYYHMVQEHDSFDSLVSIGSNYLRHVHFAREMGRGYPSMRDMDLRYDAFFHALRSMNYQGRISLEAYSDAPEKELAMALAFFKEMTQER